MGVLSVFFALCVATLCYSKSFDVMDYGAVGDGETDDSQAFTKAWEATCGAESNHSNLKIPKDKTFLLQPLTFQGPCKSLRVHLKLEGNIVAPSNINDWKCHGKNYWLGFKNVAGLTLDGNGQIDGKGSQWWEKFPNVPPRPSAVMFRDCSNMHVHGWNSMNTPRNHISISGCVNATLSHLNLTAPEHSPNTDGIDIFRSKNIHIKNSFIGTGDDCVAINTETYGVHITGLSCGPGHGISIGSLGGHGQKAAVENIHVKNCTLTSTQNGARIKTWQGGSGYARNITFKDIKLINAGKPVLIDQFYCPHSTCGEQASAVEISDVSFSGIEGTTCMEDAITLNCSDSVGCRGILLDDIDIKSSVAKYVPRAHCNNAQGKANNVIPQVDCLKNS